MSVIDGIQGGKIEFTRQWREADLLEIIKDASYSLLLIKDGSPFGVSLRFRHEFGYEEPELGGLLDLIFPDAIERERLLTLVNINLSGRRAFQEDFTLADAAGRRVRSRIYFEVLRLENDSPVCVCFLHQAPPPAEEGFAWDDLVFKTICDYSLNGITLVDENMHALYVNAAALEIYGCRTEEEFKKINFINTVHPDDLNFLAERVKRRMEGKPNPPRFSYRLLRPSGEVRWVEVLSRVIVVGGHRCNLNSLIDISERVKMEREALETDQRYRLLAENVTDVIWAADLDWKIVYVSPSARSLLGYEETEILGNSPEKLMTPEGFRLARDTHRFLMSEKAMGRGGDGSYSLEIQLVKKDGTMVWTEVRTSLIQNDRGEPIGVMGVSRDIGKRKAVQDALGESERRLKQALRTEVRRLRARDYIAPFGADASFEHYPSPAMKRAIDEAKMAIRSEGSLLILGESGVGKSFLAGWIHHHSRRSDGPFFDISCAAIAPSLIESELFGHEPGAFTGSRGLKRGLLELADGGTLFLDEIGDMDPALQTKLLGFLDTRTMRRIGGGKTIKVDARVIAATNRDLEKLVENGIFRQDLFYRLNALMVRMPPLRERREDIPILAAKVLKKICSDMAMKETPELGPDAVAALVAYGWPGNIRELRNVLERAVLTSSGAGTITGEMLGLARIQTPVAPAKIVSPAGTDIWKVVDDFTARVVMEAISITDTRAEAAKLLGISRHALSRLAKKLGLDDRN